MNNASILVLQKIQKELMRFSAFITYFDTYMCPTVFAATTT